MLKFQFFLQLFVNIFHIYHHIKRKIWLHHAPQLYQWSSEKLCFDVNYVQSVKQQHESKTIWKAPLQSKWLLWKVQTIYIVKESHYVQPPNQHFLLSAKMAKEDTGKSMKNTLFVLWYNKRDLLGWAVE